MGEKCLGEGARGDHQDQLIRGRWTLAAYLHTGRPRRPGSGKRCRERPTKARMARPVGTRVLGTCAQEPGDGQDWAVRL